MSPLLFTPGRIGTLELKSRIIMSAMHLGLSLPQETAFLAERARGGASLVTTVMGVSHTAAASDMPVLCEENRDDVRRMAEAVHNAGGKLSVQLFHVGRNCEEGCLADPSSQPVAPSPVPSPIYRSVPRELTEAEIGEIIRQFAAAAVFCRECGVDAAEVSCSAGYLLSEFLSCRTNLRTDGYGGDFAARMRMPLSVLEAVRRAAGEDYPVILRISGADMLGGYGLADMQEFVRRASPWADAVNVTGGWHESPVPQISMDVPEGGFAFLAKAIRRVTDRPVITCNRIASGECAERLLREGCGDFVGCARAFLADPAFAEKLLQDLPYIKCIGCNKGCIEHVLRHQPATCIFNPTVGREGKLPLPKTEVPKRILTVGGGPAGLLAARYFAEMGNEVTLCNRESEWGGLLRYAGLAPHKEAILHNVKTLVREAEEAGVRLLPGTEVDEAYLAGHDYDFYLIAEGCRERIPEIEGASCRRVYTASELFEADGDALDRLAGKRICIIGGGSTAAELAWFLIKRTQPSPESREFLELFAAPELRDTLRPEGKITVLCRGTKVARDLGGTRWILMKQLSRFPVELLTECTIRKITETGVEALEAGRPVTVEADMVVLAAGYLPRDSGLAQFLQEKQKPFALLGDCARQGGGILSATRSAWETAAFYGGVWNEQNNRKETKQ